MTTHVLPREYRRIWFWRHSPLMFTVFVCLFLGGIVSEFVQSMLPVRPPLLSLDLQFPHMFLFPVQDLPIR
jgi:hypothetical protein